MTVQYLPSPNPGEETPFKFVSHIRQVVEYLNTYLIGSKTVATLPTANADNIFARRFVTDATTAVTFGTTLTGGGAVTLPVYSDGTNWRAG